MKFSGITVLFPLSVEMEKRENHLNWAYLFQVNENLSISVVCADLKYSKHEKINSVSLLKEMK